MMAETVKGRGLAWLSSQGRWQLAIWALALVSWAYLLIATGGHLLAISVWSLPFLLMIALVSTPWRSITWKTVGAFFMLGFGPVFALSALVGSLLAIDTVERVLRDFLGLFGDLGIITISRDLVAPVTEELLKVLPLVLVVMLPRFAWRHTTGPIDYAVLAGATGAGLAFAEDIFVFLYQGLPGPTSDIYALGLGPIYGNLVGAGQGFTGLGRSTFADLGAFFFPEMQELFGVVWMGHGGLALGIGLALGLAIWLREETGSRWWYVLPILTYVWAVWEHVMGNWYREFACSDDGPALCTVAHIDLRGRVLPLLVLAGFGYAVYVSGRVLRSHRYLDRSLQQDWKQVNRSSYRARGWRGRLAMIRDRLDFLRWRRRTAYAAFHLERAQDVNGRKILAVLACRTEAIQIKERLEGSTPTPVPERVEAIIDASVPVT